MGLKDLPYQEDYRSGYADIVADFIRPALLEATLYCRAVGYFSSSALESFGQPLGDFIKNGGSIRLVTSVELSSDDLQAITDGVPREQICARRLEQIIDDEFIDGVGDGVTRLARLLELGRMEVKIAMPKNGTGIYHEKIGIFLDGADFVAFTGSSNESRNAFENNRECVDVYTSWDSKARAERKKSHFDLLWAHDDQGVEVYSFPEAARRKLLIACRRVPSGSGGRRQQDRIWRHQEQAVAIFLEKQRGVLNMATGTGKTRIALEIMSSLYRADAITTAVICADGNDLLDQWYIELLSSRRCFRHDIRILRHYKQFKQIDSFVVDAEGAILLVSRDAASFALADVDIDLGKHTLLVHDEVHRLGSPGNLERLSGLSDRIRYRLGLSATPERPYDDKGNSFIEQHIGPVIADFGVEEAIQRGILCPFNYNSLYYEASDEDRRRIRAVYARKRLLESEARPMSEAELWTQIAKVYKTSIMKIPVFEAFIQHHAQLLRRCIIFTETMEYGRRVLECVHRYRPDFHTYFSGEDQLTLQRFASGELECLVTCHRLSEGIDVRSLNTVILFSSERGRLETIQRIGRCLRTDPDRPQKIASIVDFVRMGDDGTYSDTDLHRRDWLLGLSRCRKIQ